MRKSPVEWILRGLYSVVLYLLLPITVYHLVWRGFRVREYFQRWDERYASYPHSSGQPRVWLHAVSVGEVNAAAPLVNALRAQRPDIRWVITTITPTGSERVRALWGDAVDHVYLPYDVPGSVGRFLGHFKPSLALILETELWPNLLFGCRDRRIPVYILNARLSARSLRGYRLLRPLIGRALRTVTCVAAQSADDAERFLQLGATPEQVQALGNLKFDIATPNVQDFIARFHDLVPAERPVWIAASTHEGEEQATVDLHRRLREAVPGLLLLWAPSGAFSTGGGAGPRAGLEGRHAAPAAVAAGRHRCVRDRYPGRADVVLRVCPGGLRRWQPAGDRRAQPARARCDGHGHGDRPAPAQLRRDFPAHA